MSESILSEAERLTNGARRGDYGHPLDDFTRTGRMWAAILGVPEVTAEQVALMMCALKISRECNAHKRDNLVDQAGYVNTLQMVLDERERRAFQAQGGGTQVEVGLTISPTLEQGPHLGVLVSGEPHLHHAQCPKVKNPSYSCTCISELTESRAIIGHAQTCSWIAHPANNCDCGSLLRTHNPNER